MNGRIRFYDATLTEGPGYGRLTPEQRIQLARELDASHVDFVEIGIVVPQNGHLHAQTMVEGFRPQHAQTAYQVVLAPDGQHVLTPALQAETPVITLRGPLEPPDATRRDEHRRSVVQAITTVKRAGRMVIFKAVDFFALYRRDPTTTWDMLSVLWDAGVDILTLGDEAGRSLPWEVATATYEVRRRFPQLSLGFWMTNVNACADDNALSAVDQGVSLIHGTLHGYGQNQGYTDLACVGAALWRQRQAMLTSQDLEHLWDWSEILHKWLYAPPSRA